MTGQETAHSASVVRSITGEGGGGREVKRRERVDDSCVRMSHETVREWTFVSFHFLLLLTLTKST